MNYSETKNSHGTSTVVANQVKNKAKQQQQQRQQQQENNNNNNNNKKTRATTTKQELIDSDICESNKHELYWKCTSSFCEGYLIAYHRCNVFVS
eukprot:4015596-Amphidinium_carterae.1